MGFQIDYISTADTDSSDENILVYFKNIQTHLFGEKDAN